MKKNVILEAKPIGDIKGVFNIPAYQRGYRWGKLQVKTLLNDLYQKANDSTKKDYCLQPIVVLRKGEGEYDLIDGQQRLTTIYILLNYIRQFFPFVQLNFSLTYETRMNTQVFLNNMDESTAQTNIDFSISTMPIKPSKNGWRRPSTMNLTNNRLRFSISTSTLMGMSR